MPDRTGRGGESMTDARHPDRWLTDRRLAKLTDTAYRLFTTSLLWSVSNRTDGIIDAVDLGLIPHVDTNCVTDLVSAGLWEPQPDGWLIVDYAATQTTRRQLEHLEKARIAEREKKARQRANIRAGHAAVPEDDTPPPIQDRQGKDRLGQEDLPAHNETNTEQQSPPLSALGKIGCSSCGRVSRFELVDGQCRKCRYGS